MIKNFAALLSNSWLILWVKNTFIFYRMMKKAQIGCQQVTLQGNEICFGCLGS